VLYDRKALFELEKRRKKKGANDKDCKRNLTKITGWLSKDTKKSRENQQTENVENNKANKELTTTSRKREKTKILGKKDCKKTFKRNSRSEKLRGKVNGQKEAKSADNNGLKAPCKEKCLQRCLTKIRQNRRREINEQSDMTIETSLMRSFTAQGGLKKGRGVTVSVVSKWIEGISITHDVCTLLEEFCGVHFTSSGQHKDFGEARITKDIADIAKLTTWLENHPPFPETIHIMSIATEMVGADTVNCYAAVRRDKQAINKW
ncbi:hypothetical protein ILUMI_16050, partial [Ignelater luminosus]